MDRAVKAIFIGVLLLSNAAVAGAQSLKGSPVAMQRQNGVAVDHDYSFLQTSADVRRFAELGLLVRLPGNADYELIAVSHAYARPAVKLFVERIARQYRAACGEKLIVTSLTRPVREQPRNASELSVHPAGMAVDLRVSKSRSCRNWLEKTLLTLEKQGVLDAIREKSPPHYHVALFPEPYTQYVARLSRGTPSVRVAEASPRPSATTSPRPETTTPTTPTVAPVAAAAQSEEEPGASFTVTEESIGAYRVNRGDSLWSIARRHGTTVDTLKELNGLKSTQIVAGQVITVPVAAGAGSN